MTCQNCGHTPAAHIWKDDPERSDCGQPCDCTAYREPEPAEILLDDDDMGDATPMTGEAAIQYRPAVTDLPDAVVEAAADALFLHARDGNPPPRGFDRNDVDGDWLARDWQKRAEYARIALAAASGPWEAHLEAKWAADKQSEIARLSEHLDAARAEADELFHRLHGSRAELDAALARLKAREDDVDRLIDERDAALARNAELENDVDWWRDKFDALFDEREAEYKRHRASPLKSGGNIHILQVRVTDQLFKRINRYRKPKNLSVSATARELIEVGFEEPALRAELDNLRDRVTALCDESEADCAEYAEQRVKDKPWTAGDVHTPMLTVEQVRAAIVRGSDDAGEDE